MSKKPQRRKFRIGKVTTQDEVQATVNRAIQAYNYTVRKLTPLIKGQYMGAAESVVLIACYADSVIQGRENDETHSITQNEIEGATYLLLELWKRGKVQPPQDYPYTLEETLTLFKENSEAEA